MNWKLMCRDMAPWGAGEWLGCRGKNGGDVDVNIYEVVAGEGTYERVAVDEAHPCQALEEGRVAPVLEEGQEVDEPADGGGGDTLKTWVGGGVRDTDARDPINPQTRLSRRRQRTTRVA